MRERDKRRNGEGTIRQRADGRWEVLISLGRNPLTGKRARKSAFAKTEAEAVQKLRDLNGRAAGGLVMASTPKVAEFLDHWYTANSDTWRASTRRSYRAAIDLYLTPAFGHLRVEHVTPPVIQQWLLDHKTKHGARRRISLAHAVLRSALREAVYMRLVSTNAATLVKVPRHKKRGIVVLDVAQAQAFLARAERHRLAPLFSVALACGLRLGEACGLKWEDLDLETGALRIRQQVQRVDRKLTLVDLKTAKSRRTLMLPDVCIEALRRHRQQQLRTRLRAGANWVETGLIFTTYRKRTKAGLPLHPRNVLRLLHHLLTTATPPLPVMRFHDLRHSAASLLLASGVPLEQLSQLLGHSEMRITLDLYAHLQQETAARAARHMDAILKAK